MEDRAILFGGDDRVIPVDALGAPVEVEPEADLSWIDEAKHLPELLRRRAKKAKMPAGVAKAQFMFDRCGVWQLADDENETFRGSKLIKAGVTKSRDLLTAPRGVLVSAGAQALDYFNHHGIELGHIVWFVRLSPWRRVVDMVAGREAALVVLRASDIIASEDLMTVAAAAGKFPYEWNEEKKQHRIAGVELDRADPPVSEDY